MRSILLFLLTCSIFASCLEPKCDCDTYSHIQNLNDSLITEMRANDNFKIKEYWNRFDEPVLEDQAIESFRFSITVLLSDYQKIYRIEKEDEVISLHVKEYAVPTTIAFRNDSLVSEKTKLLNIQDWNEIKKTINQNCFWTLPTDVEKRVLDGSSWLLEGYNPKANNCTDLNYHFAYRASPDSSNFTIISEKIMSLDSFQLRSF